MDSVRQRVLITTNVKFSYDCAHAFYSFTVPPGSASVICKNLVSAKVNKIELDIGLEAGPPVRNFDWGGGGQTFPSGRFSVSNTAYFHPLVKCVYELCELNYNSPDSQEIAGLSPHYSAGSVKTTFFNSYEDTVWPPQCQNFYSTAGAGGFNAGAAAPAVTC